MTKRILHIGSHWGNIGDNASHSVVYSHLSRHGTFEFVPLEIRRFYRNANDLRFDDSFVSFANSHDGVLVGGGNFFELGHEYSATGTTIDWHPQTLAGLQIPVVFSAVGFDPAKGADARQVARFRSFCEMLGSRKRTLVSLRQDGSVEDFENLIGRLSDFGFVHAADPGLFFTAESRSEHYVPDDIAFNIAGDMLERRYGSANEAARSLQVFREAIESLPEPRKATFVPHVLQDYAALELLRGGKDSWVLRRRLVVGPCMQGAAGFRAVFSAYSHAGVVVANRFHALLCNVQTAERLLVIDNYPKIGKTLRALGLVVEKVDLTSAEQLYNQLSASDPMERARRQEVAQAHYATFVALIERIAGVFDAG